MVCAEVLHLKRLARCKEHWSQGNSTYNPTQDNGGPTACSRMYKSCTEPSAAYVLWWFNMMPGAGPEQCIFASDSLVAILPSQAGPEALHMTASR
jgi:hypothetical protein